MQIYYFPIAVTVLKHNFPYELFLYHPMFLFSFYFHCCGYCCPYLGKVLFSTLQQSTRSHNMVFSTNLIFSMHSSQIISSKYT